jgi:hypothetical protein
MVVELNAVVFCDRPEAVTDVDAAPSRSREVCLGIERRWLEGLLVVEIEVVEFLVNATDIAVAGSCDLGDFIDGVDVDLDVVEDTASGVVVGDCTRVELFLDLEW